MRDRKKESSYPGAKGWLDVHWGRAGLAVYIFFGCLISMIPVGLIALAIHEPLLAPSLGPTVLLFFEKPLQPPACPRNALIGHGIGIAAGWSSLAAFGLLDSPSALSVGFSFPYVGAAALSVAVTAIAKDLCRVSHPPAGASTLIVSLGLLTTPVQLGSLAAGVVLVTLVAWLVNRMFGVPMPVWGPAS